MKLPVLCGDREREKRPDDAVAILSRSGLKPTVPTQNGFSEPAVHRAGVMFLLYV